MTAPRPVSSQATGDLPAAIREWCDWIYTQAVLAKNAAPRDARDPDGKPTTWLTYCGMYEARLIQAAMRSNVWSEP